MKEWSKLLGILEKWRVEDNEFGKCINSICLWWSRQTDSEKKRISFFCKIFIVLLVMSCMYDLGVAFGKLLYNIGI